MTLSRFNRLLKKVNPQLHLRHRGYGDIVGLFAKGQGNSGYIARMTKGELTTAGWREAVRSADNIMEVKQGRIKKRGRKTIIMILRNYRWLKTHKQRSMLSWGIEVA